MKRKFKNAAFIIGILVTGLFSGCDRPWTGQIMGTVTDSETEEGIPGVFVMATALKNDYSVSTITDETGQYRIRDARWGSNSIRVYHPRFFTAEKYADVIRDAVVEVDFSVGKRTLYMDTELHVRVVNANGDPVNQAVVDLYQLRESIYEYYFYLATKVTEEDGALTFLLPRIYEDEVIRLQLRVAALGYHDRIRDVAVSWGTFDPEITIVLDLV